MLIVIFKTSVPLTRINSQQLGTQGKRRQKGGGGGKWGVKRKENPLLELVCSFEKIKIDKRGKRKKKKGKRKEKEKMKEKETVFISVAECFSGLGLGLVLEV